MCPTLQRPTRLRVGTSQPTLLMKFMEGRHGEDVHYTLEGIPIFGSGTVFKMVRQALRKLKSCLNLIFQFFSTISMGENFDFCLTNTVFWVR